MNIPITIGNIWDFYDAGNWVAVTTNGIVKNTGCLTMGRGIANDARLKFPGIDQELGELVSRHGNVPFSFPSIKIVTLPTKNHWRGNSDIELIIDSMNIIYDMSSEHQITQPIYCPLVGCGYGNLSWTREVEPLLRATASTEIFKFVARNEGEIN